MESKFVQITACENKGDPFVVESLASEIQTEKAAQ
jgi:hypothetical protein